MLTSLRQRLAPLTRPRAFLHSTAERASFIATLCALAGSVQLVVATTHLGEPWSYGLAVAGLDSSQLVRGEVA